MGKSLAKTRTQWAKTINQSWAVALKAATVAVKAGIETGKYLIDAKKELPHGEFTKMVEEDLAFSEKKAQDLMFIARSPQITNPQHATVLPTGWTVLREMANLTPQDFEWAIDQGLITSETTRGATEAIRKARTTTDKVVKVREGQRGPTPDEARKIARATGKLVAASDGHVYSGATVEEGEAHAEKRSIVYGIKEAVMAISECELTPQQWIDQAQDHWIHDFNARTIEQAISWLTNLKPLIAKRQLKVVRHAQ